jgi:hypothetical protein
MEFRFHHHYSPAEARALLPHVRQWLEQIQKQRDQIVDLDRKLQVLMADRDDVGGPTVNAWVEAFGEIKRWVREFQSREIQIKDVERGLIDFPAIVAGREVFLCWEKDEDDIEFWHDLDAGYAGREPL